MDVSPRSPKSPRSPALLGYPLSPTGSAGLSSGLRFPLTPRFPVEVDIYSPRSLSPVSSPVCTSSVFSRAEWDFDAEYSRDVNVVLQVMQRQGELDARVECAKSTISTSIPLGGVVDHTDVSTDSERAMMSAVTQQSGSIDIEIDQYSVQLYSSGRFIASCGSHLDHGVSTVGYRCEAGTDCWKVKNSWGSS